MIYIAKLRDFYYFYILILSSVTLFLNISKMTKNIFKNVRFSINVWAYIPKINPLGQFRIIWDIFVGSSTLYLFFTISLSLSFSKLVLLDYLPLFISVFIIGTVIDLNTGYYE